MSNRDEGRQPPARASNWLKTLDEKAKSMPRATDWLSPYGPFMLARYPNLRPQPVPGNVPSQMRCKSDERTAAQQFAEWETRIASNQETAVCLNNLDEEQRRQLAALLLETIDNLEMRTATAGSAQWVRHIHKEVEPRLRMLDRKLQIVRKAAEELKAYAVDAGEENAHDASKHKARVQLGMEYLFTAAAVLGALDKNIVRTAEAHRNATSGFLTPKEDVEVFGMVRLYWFFCHGCNLTGDESEVRVARLRNAFWTEYGVSAVKYRPKYIVGQSLVCEAVHVAVRRFRP